MRKKAFGIRPRKRLTFEVANFGGVTKRCAKSEADVDVAEGILMFIARLVTLPHRSTLPPLFWTFNTSDEQRIGIPQQDGTR